MNEIRENFYNLGEMCESLRIKKSTMMSRIYTGTDHPPYTKLFGEYLFPKEHVLVWVKKKRLVYEVKSAR